MYGESSKTHAWRSVATIVGCSYATLASDIEISFRDVILDFVYVRFALNRADASAQQVFETHGATLQGGLAKLWRAQECDGLASVRYINRQKDMWSKAYPNGLADAQTKIGRWFEAVSYTHLRAHETLR